MQCPKYTAEVVCVKVVKVLWLSCMMKGRLRELLIIQTGYIELSDQTSAFFCRLKVSDQSRKNENCFWNPFAQ